MQIARHLNEDDTLLDEEYLRQLSTDTDDTEVIANSQSLLLRLVKTLNLSIATGKMAKQIEAHFLYEEQSSQMQHDYAISIGLTVFF